jgi:hypothetical protein
MSVFSLIELPTRILRRRKREADLKHAATWPTHPARLLKSAVVPKDLACEDSSDLQSSQVESAYFFTLKSGSEDEGYFGGHLRSLPVSDSEANRLLAKLPEDTPVLVRYNPRNPDQTHTLATDNPGFPIPIWPS